MTTESQGPDPCRGGNKCQDFHDTLGRQVGTGSALDGCYNCCCCDPCRFVHPEPLTDEEDERYYCCKCVPRGLYLRFTPDDSEEDCCRQVGTPFFQAARADGDYITRYTVEMFEITVTVEIGRVSGTGTGTGLDCGWKITTGLTGAGSGSPDEQIIEIDHSETTCLYIPEGIELARVEGPEGCPGTLSLENLEKVKLPFLKRTDTTDFSGPSFIDISSDPCGNGTGTGSGSGGCREVCSRICATGTRSVDGSREFVEFQWFDDGTGTGSGSGTGQRGWQYYNPVTDYVERLILTEESGDCIITPDLKSGAEDFPPITLEDGCSCKLNEQFTTGLIEGQVWSFKITCGFCSCWEFVCGSCRCAPYELCAMVFIGKVAYPNIVVTWDPDLKAWVSDNRAIGTAEADYFLRLDLQENDNGQCAIVVYVNNEVISVATDPIFGCGAETVTGQFTGQSDIITISVDGTMTEFTGTGNGDTPVTVIASSLIPECELAPCTEATPCANDCGSHPAELTVTVHEWAEEGDTSGDPTDCTTEFTVYYWQTVTDVIDGEVIYACGYVGYSLNCVNCIIEVQIRNGSIFFDGVPLDCGFSTLEFEFDSESCDPYSASFEDLAYGAGVFGTCAGCNGEQYRLNISVTE